MSADLAALDGARPATPPVAVGTGRPCGARVVGQRYLAIAAMALALGALHLRHRPSTVCPFRALTGLPCPFCGGTTAAVQLGHGHVGQALLASPLAVGAFATWPWLGSVRTPRWLRVRRHRLALLAGALILAEAWQLVRFGILPNPF